MTAPLVNVTRTPNEVSRHVRSMHRGLDGALHSRAKVRDWHRMLWCVVERGQCVPVSRDGAYVEIATLGLIIHRNSHGGPLPHRCPVLQFEFLCSCYDAVRPLHTGPQTVVRSPIANVTVVNGTDG